MTLGVTSCVCHWPIISQCRRICLPVQTDLSPSADGSVSQCRRICLPVQTDLSPGADGLSCVCHWPIISQCRRIKLCVSQVTSPKPLTIAILKPCMPPVLSLSMSATIKTPHTEVSGHCEERSVAIVVYQRSEGINTATGIRSLLLKTTLHVAVIGITLECRVCTVGDCAHSVVIGFI